MAEQNVTDKYADHCEELASQVLRVLHAEIKNVCVSHRNVPELIEGLEVGSRNAQRDVRLLIDNILDGEYGRDIFPLIIFLFGLLQEQKAEKEDVDIESTLLKSTILGAFDRFPLGGERHGSLVFVPVMRTSCPTEFDDELRSRIEGYCSQHDDTRQYYLISRDTGTGFEVELATVYSHADLIAAAVDVLTTSNPGWIGDRPSLGELKFELETEPVEDDDPTFQYMMIGVVSDNGLDAVDFNPPERAERLRGELLDMLGLPEAEVGLPIHPNAMGRASDPPKSRETSEAEIAEMFDFLSSVAMEMATSGFDPAIPHIMGAGRFQAMLAGLPDDQPIKNQLEQMDESDKYDALNVSMLSTAIDVFRYEGSNVAAHRLLVGVPYGKLLSTVALDDLVTDPVSLLPADWFNITDVHDAVEGMATVPAQTLVDMGISGQAELHQDLVLGNTLNFRARATSRTWKEIDPGKDNELKVAVFSVRRTALKDAGLTKITAGSNLSYGFLELPLVTSNPLLLSKLCPEVLDNMAAFMRLLSLFYRVLGSAHAPALETDFHGNKVVVRSMDDGVDFEEETLPVEHWWSLQPFIQKLAAQNGVDDRTSAGGHA